MFKTDHYENLKSQCWAWSSRGVNYEHCTYLQTCGIWHCVVGRHANISEGPTTSIIRADEWMMIILSALMMIAVSSSETFVFIH